MMLSAKCPPAEPAAPDYFATPCRLLKLPEVMMLTAASKASIYAWILDGNFPKPRKLGNRRVAWLAGDVKKWIDSRPGAEYAEFRK